MQKPNAKVMKDCQALNVGPTLAKSTELTAKLVFIVLTQDGGGAVEGARDGGQFCELGVIRAAGRQPLNLLARL